MSHTKDLYKLKEEQEKILKETINRLEAQQDGLDMTKEQNQISHQALNQKIQEAHEDLAKVKEEKTSLEREMRKADWFQLDEKFSGKMEGLKEMVDVAATAVMIANLHSGMPQMHLNSLDMQEQLNKPVAAIEIVQEYREKVEKDDANSISVDKVESDLEKFNDKIESLDQANSIGRKIKDSLPDQAKKWKDDIADREKELTDSFESQKKAISRNEDMLTIEKIDSLKFPDSEKRIKDFESMDKVIHREKELAVDKFEKGIEELNREKEALKNAIESTSHMEQFPEQRNEEIRKQREEYERQRELERIKDIQGRT